jgi:hypothetical protein
MFFISIFKGCFKTFTLIKGASQDIFCLTFSGIPLMEQREPGKRKKQGLVVGAEEQIGHEL